MSNRSAGTAVRRSWLAALAVLAAACATPESPLDPQTSPQPARLVDGVAYRADTAILESFPVVLRTEVTVRNETAAPVSIQLADGCTVLLRAYRTETRAGAPAWDQLRSAICTMQLVGIDLAPGEEEKLGVMVNAREILGDSLPNGTYYLTAVVRPVGGTVEIAAGRADLAR